MVNREYYTERHCNDEFVLEDSQTKLYLKMKTDKVSVKVDDGIIKNNARCIKKCDYLLYDCNNKQTFLIELKGKVIDEAYKQLYETIKNINESDKHLIENLNKLESYIVSPCPKVPKNSSSKGRLLAAKLAEKSLNKPKNMFELIKYVKVLPKGNRGSISEQNITITPKFPLYI